MLLLPEMERRGEWLPPDEVEVVRRGGVELMIGSEHVCPVYCSLLQFRSLFGVLNGYLLEKW